jgi:hypothetical protein
MPDVTGPIIAVSAMKTCMAVTPMGAAYAWAKALMMSGRTDQSRSLGQQFSTISLQGYSSTGGRV